ncbi:MAG: hypothetical protein IKF17_01010 [Clostridia bacterium]|nr:hypothetical protein [Clostridia bacterium]
MKRISKFIIFFSFVTIIFFITSISYAKYVIDYNIIAAKLNIDRTKPIGVANYSTKDPTRENVTVTININEPINEVEGWALSEDKCKLVKTFENNEITNVDITDLSGNKNSIEVKVDNIDREAPMINLIDIRNTNINYENYANKTHKIFATIEIKDMQLKNIAADTHISVIVGEEKSNCKQTISKIQQSDTSIILELELTGIEGNGDLQVIIPDGFAIDSAGNFSKQKKIDFTIKIDNEKPKGDYSQISLESGKIEAKIKTNEEIRNIENWENYNNNTFKKVFPANVSYIIEILDYAQNKSEVEVHVTNATYIILTYAAHNSNIGWTYGLGNYDIAGKKAIEANPILKIEALAFKVTGKCDTDFVKFRGYVNSYWNNTSEFGKCRNTGYKYKLREAPEELNSSYYTMSSQSLSTINNEKYVQFGGAGINMVGNTDYEGKNPISFDAIYNQNPFPYGISSIEIALKNYTELSVVYQILVYGKGWIKTCTNGEIASVGSKQPMSAIRAAIIPKSETKKLVELWDKDIGTYNVN